MHRSMSNSICNSVVYWNSPIEVTSSHSNYSESDNCKQGFWLAKIEKPIHKFPEGKRLTSSLLENIINSFKKLSLRFSHNNQLLFWTLCGGMDIWYIPYNFKQAHRRNNRDYPLIMSMKNFNEEGENRYAQKRWNYRISHKIISVTSRL